MPRILRWLAATLTAAVVLSCVVLLAVRFVALPQLESRRADIADYLARQLGHPVEIESIATGWDGWNPQVTVRGVRVRDGTGNDTLPLLELPGISGVIAWTSLALGRLQFRELAIDGARLAIRRDPAGRVHVAGIEIDPETTSDDNAFVEWLLQQRQIVVRDALVTWNDDRRNAPQLVLDRVRFRLENRFGRHRLGLTGIPPSEIASPIDVRADLATESLRDWRLGNGELYVRLDYADLAAWREWLPLPASLAAGKGALRTWFHFEQGIANRIVADLELADVRAQLGPELHPFELAHVSGRVSWKQGMSEREFATRSLTFTPRGGPAVPPLDFWLAYRMGPGGETTGGEARADRIDLEPLATIAGELPLPADWRAQLDRLAPSGAVVEATYEWKGSFERPTSFRARGKVQDLGVRGHDDGPGFAGLSGTVDVSDQGGTVRVDSRHARLSLPRIFPQPIALDSAIGQVVWEARGEEISLRGTIAELSNADAAAGATFAWRGHGKGPGTIDLDAKVIRADARRLDRYLPLQLDPAARTWIQRAVRQGTGSDGRLVLKGDLGEFPFANGRNGQFLVTAKVRGATLDYAESWPPITDIDGDLRLEGNRLAFHASGGRSLGASIGRTTAEIPDLGAPRVRVEGEASGTTAQFLAFVQGSPVAGWINHATNGVDATGNGKLSLRFDLSLADRTSSVAGEYQFLANQLRAPGVPALAQLTGTLKFTEREMRATDLAFETLGGPARATITAASGSANVSAAGTARLAQLGTELPSPWWHHANGSADWKLNLDDRPEGRHWVIESSLKGVTIDLPAPLGKPADATVALRIERRPLSGRQNRDQVRVDYGTVARVVADRRIRDGDATTENALVLLGRAVQRGGEPDRPGIAVRGDVESINVDDWIAVMRTPEPSSTARGEPAVEVASLELKAGTCDVLGRAFHEMTLAGRRTGSDWRLTLASQEIEGTATWEPRGVRMANGRVSARLSRLALPGPGAMLPWAGAPRTTTARTEGDANPWPEIDLVAERYVGKRGELGRLELSAKPVGSDWRIDKLSLVNDAGALTGDGWWRSRGREQQTRLDVTLDVKDSAGYLARFGLPDAVRGAPTKIEGQLSWNGSPDEFDFPSLGGGFKVNVGAGQFTKIEPGIGKLLGVLSLQALPRRITLDFRDVFSEGFAFDSITGNVRIGNGIMHTENLQLNGPAAKVQITGEVDLQQETQRLTVLVQPSLATSVSAGAGAAAIWLLAANPVVAAAVGAGTLLAQKMMKDPIEQIFSYEYSVRGSWDEPLVDRVARGLGTPAEAGAAQPSRQ